MFANVDDTHFLKLRSYDYHVIFLFFACLVYGLFGSPTPDHLGAVELAIGVLLVFAIGFGHVRDVVVGAKTQRFWKSAAFALLIYGLSVPLILAALKGVPVFALFRDIIPFLFLFLPLLVLPILRVRPHYFRVLVVLVVLIGLLFSLRSILMRFSFYCDFWCSDELLYLENMPTVLFSALLLIGAALKTMARGLTVKTIFVFSGLVLLAMLPIAAMVMTAQRASLGAVFLYILIIQAIIIYKSPVRGLNVVIIGFIALAVLNISVWHIFQALLQKSADVGLNMRPQEMSAVWSVVTSDVVTFLFGLGWGASFYNPAVGNLDVNFTHNFFSSFLLKTGFVGVVFAVAYVGGLLERLFRVILRDPVFGLALCAPVFIDLTFYASFKSLDFGLVLLMISGSLVYMRQCADQQY